MHYTILDLYDFIQLINVKMNVYLTLLDEILWMYYFGETVKAFVIPQWVSIQRKLEIEYLNADSRF